MVAMRLVVGVESAAVLVPKNLEIPGPRCESM